MPIAASPLDSSEWRPTSADGGSALNSPPQASGHGGFAWGGREANNTREYIKWLNLRQQEFDLCYISNQTDNLCLQRCWYINFCVCKHISEEIVKTLILKILTSSQNFLIVT